MNHSEFTHKDIVKIFPWLKPRTLISWSERGLIKPTFEDASGRGSRRRYSYKNLLEISFANELLQYGIHFHTIRMLIGEFRNLIEHEDFNRVFVVNQNRSLTGMVGPIHETSRWPEGYSMEIDKFKKMPGSPFFPEKRRDSVVTSTIIFNVKRMKEFIDVQIKITLK